MDPDANLREQNEILARVRDGKLKRSDADRLDELRGALSAWLASGGFQPRAWREHA